MYVSHRVQIDSRLPFCVQIELKLLNEVSTKSTGILDALHSYEILTREVATSCGQIEALRTRMRTLETNLALKSMRLPRMARRRVHTAALLNKLRLIHAVWRTQPTIQQLLSSRDFPSALELITSSQHLLETGIHHRMPLEHILRSSCIEPHLGTKFPSWPWVCSLAHNRATSRVLVTLHAHIIYTPLFLLRTCGSHIARGAQVLPGTSSQLHQRHDEQGLAALGIGLRPG